MITRVRKAPVVGGLWTFAETRPRLAAWIVLSLGIVILLLVEARDVGLLIGQWAALIVASIVVAGLCIWIVSWEDKDEDEAVPATAAPIKAVTTGTTTAAVITTSTVTSATTAPTAASVSAPLETADTAPVAPASTDFPVAPTIAPKTPDPTSDDPRV